MLAGQLGKLQLTLRGFGEGSRAADRAEPAPPTWASDVSTALRLMDRGPARPATVAASAPAATARTSVVNVIHGSRVEQQCFGPSGQSGVGCAATPIATPTQAPAATPPGSGPPDAAMPAS
jgi:hypothetical protein